MYLNQEAEWLQLDENSPDKYGEYRYKMSSTIMVRKQDHQEEVVDLKGNKVLSKHIIYANNTSVRLGDKLDGELVVKTYIHRSLGGRNILIRCITV